MEKASPEHKNYATMTTLLENISYYDTKEELKNSAKIITLMES